MLMRTCHPERKNCLAKPSNFAVEEPALSLPKGPQQCGLFHYRCSAFSRERVKHRENALRRSWRDQKYGVLRLRKTSLRELSLRSG